MQLLWWCGRIPKYLLCHFWCSFSTWKTIVQNNKKFCMFSNNSIESSFVIQLSLRQIFQSSLKLEPCDEFLILTFPSDFRATSEALKNFCLNKKDAIMFLSASLCLRNQTREGRGLRWCKESINHNDTKQWLGGEFTFVCSIISYLKSIVGKIYGSSEDVKNNFRAAMSKKSFFSIKQTLHN